MSDHYEDLEHDRSCAPEPGQLGRDHNHDPLPDEDTAAMELARAEYDRAHRAPSLYNCLRCTQPLAKQVNIADGLCDSCLVITQNVNDDAYISERYNRYNDL